MVKLFIVEVDILLLISVSFMLLEGKGFGELLLNKLLMNV